MSAGSSDARLRARQRPDGMFALLEGNDADVDATAWGALALALPPDADRPAAESAATVLESLQREDGRLSIAPPHPGNTWPTCAAVLAWRALGRSAGALRRALDFLERLQGDHWVRPADWRLSHDPQLVGWPWVEGTSSWVEPTSFALLALAAGGRGDGVRAREGRRLLLDRQIPSGGWNYGNPAAFDRELLPSPESSGLALAALASPSGATPRAAVAASLRYLLDELPRLTTPLSLGWAALGLAAWGERPPGLDARLAACAVADPDPAEPYDSVELAVLTLARKAPQGILAALAISTSRSEGHRP